jgi:hypothetical protein
LRIIKINETTYRDLILSIDVSSSNGKMAFGIVNSCKSKEFEDGNAEIAWEMLKERYDPVSAPLLVKLERMFRDSRLGKNEDPGVSWKLWAQVQEMTNLRFKF